MYIYVHDEYIDTYIDTYIYESVKLPIFLFIIFLYLQLYLLTIGIPPNFEFVIKVINIESLCLFLDTSDLQTLR